MNTAFISEWDTNHFGFKVAKLNVASPEEILPALHFCTKEEVVLLICRCNTNDNPSVHLLEQQGFLLMDTIVDSCLDLTTWKMPVDTDLSGIRWYREEDIAGIVAIAQKAFTGYISHFHKDPRLDPDKSDSLYVQWAYNSCYDKSLAAGVVVAELEGEVVGFLSIVPPSDGKGDFGIGGMSPNAQGKGIFPKLYLFSFDWLKSQGVTWVQDKTMVNNYAELKVLIKVGMRPFNSLYTFHKWLR
jgi:hypothetical protein